MWLRMELLWCCKSKATRLGSVNGWPRHFVSPIGWLLSSLTANFSIQNCTMYCDANKCGPWAECSNDGMCVCIHGRYGKQCQYAMCSNKCVHGTCNNRTGTCDCEANYYGASCNLQLECHAQCIFGICSNDTCICQIGYYGLQCDKQCHSCQNGRCDLANGSCVCDDGYEGADCSTLTTHSQDWAWIIVGILAVLLLIAVTLLLAKRTGMTCLKKPSEYELLAEDLKQ